MYLDSLQESKPHRTLSSRISLAGAHTLDVFWASQDQLCLAPSECERLRWRLLSLLWRLEWGSDLCTPLWPSYFMEKSSSLAAVVVLPVGWGFEYCRVCAAAACMPPPLPAGCGDPQNVCLPASSRAAGSLERPLKLLPLRMAALCWRDDSSAMLSRCPLPTLLSRLGPERGFGHATGGGLVGRRPLLPVLDAMRDSWRCCTGSRCLASLRSRLLKRMVPSSCSGSKLGVLPCRVAMHKLSGHTISRRKTCSRRDCKRGPHTDV